MRTVNTNKKPTRSRAILCGVLAFGLGMLSEAQAADKTLITPTGTVDFNTDGAWAGGSKAGVGDNAWLTNAITTSRTITNGAAGPTIDNLIISNSLGSSRLMTLLLSNQTFTVSNTGTFGANGALNLKTNATATFGSLVLENVSATAGAVAPTVTVALGSRLQVNATGTLSAGMLRIGTGSSGSLLSTAVFNNLTMANTASIDFNATALANRGPDTLVVTGSFQNATGNIISSSGVSGGNGLSLVFLNGQAGTATVTNNGVIAGSWGAFNGAALNIQATGSSTDSRTNYFLNNGNLSLVFSAGAPAGGIAFTNQWVMNLVNAGSLVISNLNTSVAGGRNATIRLFLSGSEAATNLGTIAFFSTNAVPGSPTVQNIIDFRVSNGFVNAGTLTSLSPDITGNVGFTNLFTVTSGTFSNAGIVSTGVGGIGGFTIRADRSVNTGSNIVNSAVLTYQNSTGGAGILENDGLLRVDGTLVVNTLTNGSGGVIQGIGTVKALTISAGIVNPGNSVGTLTNNGNFALTSTAIARTEINSAGADQLYVVGSLTLTGGLDVVLLDAFTPTGAEVYTNMVATAGISGTANSFTNVFLSGGNYLVNAYSNGVAVGTFQVSVLDNAGADYLVLNNYVVIPEPSALLLVCVGLLGAVVLRRRR